jgi:hypothetical protein
MPVRYTINAEQRFVHAVSDGEVTAADLIEHWNDLAADPDYQAPMRKLVDYRAGPVLQLDRDGERRITAAKLQHRQVFAGERCAIVTTSDFDFGMSRMHGAHMDDSGVETATFRTLPEALAWLGVDPAAVGLSEAEP